MRYQERNHGFTLIELLVVIAVISVLLAILMPSLHLARQIAKRTQCSANLKDIGRGWIMYLDDHDGKFFRGWYAQKSSFGTFMTQDLNTDVHYGGWRGQQAYYPRPLNRFVGLEPDIQDKSGAQVFRCPSDRGGSPNQSSNEKLYDLVGTSYRTNPFLIGKDTYESYAGYETLDEAIMKRLSSFKATDVAHHDKVLLIGDYGWQHQWEPIEYDLDDLEKLAELEWHAKDEHYVMGFLDGHVRFQKIQRGHYITDEYTVLPFKELYSLAWELQRQED